MGLEVGLVGIHGEEKGLTFAGIERKKLILRPARQSNQSSLCRLHRILLARRLYISATRLVKIKASLPEQKQNEIQL